MNLSEVLREDGLCVPKDEEKEIARRIFKGNGNIVKKIEEHYNELNLEDAHFDVWRDDVYYVIVCLHIGTVVKRNFSYSERTEEGKFLMKETNWATDDLDFHLRLLNIYIKKGFEYFSNFEHCGISVDKFIRLLRITMGLCALHNEEYGLKKMIRLEELVDDLDHDIDLIRHCFVKELIALQNVGIHTPILGFYNVQRDVFITVSKTSIAWWNDSVAQEDPIAFFDVDNKLVQLMNKGCGEKPLYIIQFVFTIPMALEQLIPIPRLINDLSTIRAGPLVAKRILRTSEDEIGRICGPYIKFYGYMWNNGTMAVVYPPDYFHQIQEFVQSQIHDVLLYEKTADIRHVRILQYNTTMVIGVGFQTLYLIIGHKSSDSIAFRSRLNGIHLKHFDRVSNREEITEAIENLNIVRPRRISIQIVPQHGQLLIATFANTEEADQMFKALVAKKLKNSSLKLYPFGVKHQHDFNITEASQEERDRAIISQFTCPTCEMTGDAPNQGNSICGHIFCDSCLISYMKCQRVFPILCPATRCNVPILLRDFAARLRGSLAAGLLRTLSMRSFEYFMRTNQAGYRQCMATDCNTILFLPSLTTAVGQKDLSLSGSSSHSRIDTDVYCPGCKSRLCRKCFHPHHQTECFAEEELFRQDELTKRCPNVRCRQLIEKNAGCNHIRCSECTVHFCWICLFQAKTSGEVYSHITMEHPDHAMQIAMEAQLHFVEDVGWM